MTHRIGYKGMIQHMKRITVPYIQKEYGVIRERAKDYFVDLLGQVWKFDLFNEGLAMIKGDEYQIITLKTLKDHYIMNIDSYLLATGDNAGVITLWVGNMKKHICLFPLENCLPSYPLIWKGLDEMLTLEGSALLEKYLSWRNEILVTLEELKSC